MRICGLDPGKAVRFKCLVARLKFKVKILRDFALKCAGMRITA